MNLHPKIGHGDACVAAKGFGNGGQKRGTCLPIGIARGFGHINRNRTGHSNGTRRKNIGLHLRQHPPHIGVIDNCSSAIGNGRAPLFAVHRISQRVLIGALGHPNALHPDSQAGVVHHGEHTGHAVVFFAH